MTKLLIEPKNIQMIEELIKLNIDGIMIGIDNFCVNTPFSLSIDKLKEIIPNIKKRNIEIFILLNKNIHNKDLENLKKTLLELNNLDIDKIVFYDLSIIELCQKNNITKKLVIYQNHLNASIYSNKFYNELGIEYSILSSEITLDEILEIKNKTNMNLIIPSYGYIPIFYSRRYLVDSYLKYIKKDNKSPYYYLKEENSSQYNIIKEENFGTTIYSNSILNLIKEYTLFNTSNISYVLLKSEFISDLTFYKELNKYIALKEGKTVKFDSYWTGFLYNKTVFKVKNDEKN